MAPGALRKYYNALFSRKTPEPAAKTKARARRSSEADRSSPRQQPAAECR